MDGDLIKNYLIYVDGYKRYRCEMCDYVATQKTHIIYHLCSKKHMENLKSKLPNKEIEILNPIIYEPSIPIKINNIKIVEEPVINSPPKNKLKGKTFLTSYCCNALTIDTSLSSMEHWIRNIDITDDDKDKWQIKTPNDFILYFFMKLIKEIGINNFPFRCVDNSRKRFYYNDAVMGWIEDIGNIEIIKLIKNLFCSVNLNSIQLYNAGYLEMELERLNEIILIYSFWGESRVSVEETLNKTSKRAEIEKVEALNVLSQLLRINDD